MLWLGIECCGDLDAASSRTRFKPSLGLVIAHPCTLTVLKWGKSKSPNLPRAAAYKTFCRSSQLNALGRRWLLACARTVGAQGCAPTSPMDGL